ncbi:MAG TPA: endonuclease, partial [Marinagarivorans sp.]
MTYTLAWWNLENLFDVEHSTARPEWLQRALANELAGWSDAVLAQKIRQLAKVICAMNNRQGPDILGVCEVESKGVINKLINQLDLPGRHYGVVHADTQDKRGIDTALIYDKHRFSVDKHAVFNHVVLKRNATRDILQATFKTNKGNEFVVIANHWPSRRG